MASKAADIGEPIALSYKQACAKLGGISMSQLYRIMRAGEITPVELGPRIRRIPLADLEDYLKRKVDERDAKGTAA